jgi:periplasmic protein TonB
MASYLQRSLIDPILPWDKDEIESGRFKRILLIIVVLVLVSSAIIPFLTVTKPDRTKATSIPPRLVKMVLEQKKEVKPPPIPEQPKEEEPEPELEKEQEPEKKTEPEKAPEPEKKPIEKPSAKQVAKKHIAVFDALADLREPDDMQAIKSKRSLSKEQGKAATVTRSLITKKATQGSGGVKVASASRSSGTGTLAGQNTTNVKSDINDAVENTKQVSKSGSLKRSSENIQLAFDKYYSQIFSPYQRALRKNPALQGRVRFNLVIQPDGSVSACTILSSELNDPALEKRLISKIKKMKFGAQNVAVWTGPYLINFFPN